MKTNTFEALLGGSRAGHLSRDAAISLHSASRRINERLAEEELFETAVRHADDEQLRALARLRIDSAASSHLD